MNLYRLKTVGISFRLPPQISNKGEWKEEKIEGETGTVVCFHLPQGSTGLIPKAYAGGIGICNEQVGIPFVMGGSSADFSAGREGVVTDLQGFVKRNDRYYVRFGKSEIEVTVPVKEYVHENGVEILKIYGSKTNGPTIWPNEGWIWAIINTKDDVYRGISLSTSLHVVDEETLDHLLSTITHSQ